MRVKICLVGDRGVGKTSLINRFVEDKFQPDEKGTLGAHMHPVVVEIPLDREEVAKVKVDLFDFMGEKALRDNFRDAIFYGAHGALAVCDLGRPDTLHSLITWIEAVTEVAGSVPAVVAFNKSDLGGEIAIGASEMRWLVEKLPGVPTVMTSARTGKGVEDAFNKVILRSVDGILDAQRHARSRETLRYQLLGVIGRREAAGLTKGELIDAFKSWGPKPVMEELDNLVELGLVNPVEYTEVSFVNTQAVPLTTHFAITAQGKETAANPRAKDLVIGEP